ncbi:MAG TPA: hypothetical protein VHM91_17945, partial [Verrucomicrobiales bacterium]|nr:hypothetical protein [Verrucomicrobiales bacterium]
PEMVSEAQREHLYRAGISQYWRRWNNIQATVERKSAHCLKMFQERSVTLALPPQQDVPGNGHRHLKSLAGL